MIFIHAPVGEHHDIHTVPVGTIHLHKQPVNGALQAGVFVIGDGNHLHLEALRLHTLDFHQIRIGQNRIMNLQDIAVSGRLFQDVAVRPDIDRGGRHHLLADGVDRRVGHLGKLLLEIVKQRMMGCGENRKGRVNPHGRNSFPAALRHGEDAGL